MDEVVEGEVEGEDSAARATCRPWDSLSQTSSLCLVKRAHCIPYVILRNE